MPFWKKTIQNLKESRKYPGVFPLLIAFYFFSDAIVTVTLFAAIYLQVILQASDTLKVILFIVVETGFALGAFFGGLVSDALGHRKALMGSLALTAVTIVGLSTIHSSRDGMVIFTLFGLGMGVVYASSRAYLASLIPEEESGKFFGLYVFAERCSSIVGPATWGIVIFLFAGLYPLNYRLAAIAMAILSWLNIKKQQRMVKKLLP